nr:hypothetical protein [Tanacetum cinerariifolium]
MAVKGLSECKASKSKIRRIQVKDIVKEVENYLKTYLSAGMDISSPLILSVGLQKFACKLDTMSSLLVQRTELCLAYEGPSDTRDTKIVALRLKFNAFKALKGEKVNGTYTRLKCLLNDLENNGMIISQSEVNATFVNSLPRKWLSMNQTQRANNSIKNNSLVSLYSKYLYEEVQIDDIYASESQRFTIQALSSKALISNNHFQDSDSDVEEDNRTNNEFMADLNAKKSLDKSKETCFTCGKLGHFQKECPSNKSSTPSFPSLNSSFNKPRPYKPLFTPNTSQNSINHQKDYKGKYKGLKAKMAVLSQRIDDLTKGKNEKGKSDKEKSENGLIAKSFDRDDESMSSENEGTTKFKAFMAIAEDEPFVGKGDARSGKGRRKENNSPKEVLFNKADVSTSKYAPMISSDSEDDYNNKEPLPPLPKLEPSGASKNLISLSDLTASMADLTLNNASKETKNLLIKYKNVLPSTEQLLLTLMEEVKGVKQYLHRFSKESGPKVVFGDNSSCDIEGYGSVNCNGITFTKTGREPQWYKGEIVEKDPIGKFDEKADDGFFRGYSPVAKAFRVSNIRRQEMEETFHVHAFDHLSTNNNITSEPKNVFDSSIPLISPTLVEILIISNDDDVPAINKADHSELGDDNTDVLQEEDRCEEICLNESGVFVNETRFRGMIGSLMYLTASRPDIQFSTCLCGRYQANPKESHLVDVKIIFMYLKGTLNLGLWYPKGLGFNLKAYSDSDYAGCNLDRKIEAEYVDDAGCCARVLWIKSQLADYDILYDKFNNGVALLESEDSSYKRLFDFLKKSVVFVALSKEPSAYYSQYLREFCFTTEADTSTNTITFSLSHLEKPLTFDHETFSTIIGLKSNEGFVDLPKKKIVKAGLPTLGLFDEEKPSLSSTALINSSLVKLHPKTAKKDRKPNICYSRYLSLVMEHLMKEQYKNDKLMTFKAHKIIAITLKTPLENKVPLTAHMCNVAEISLQPLQSLIPPSGEVNADDKLINKEEENPTSSKLKSSYKVRVILPKKQVSKTQHAEVTVAIVDATKSLVAFELAEEQVNRPSTTETKKVLITIMEENIEEKEDARDHSLYIPTVEQLLDGVDKQNTAVQERPFDTKSKILVVKTFQASKNIQKETKPTSDAEVTLMGSRPIDMNLQNAYFEFELDSMLDDDLQSLSGFETPRSGVNKVLNIEMGASVSSKDMHSRLQEVRSLLEAAVIVDDHAKEEKSQKGQMDENANPATTQGEHSNVEENAISFMMQTFPLLIKKQLWINPMPITKIGYIINSRKEPTMRITRGNDPLNLTVYSDSRLRILGYIERLELHALASKKSTKSYDVLLPNLKAKFQWVLNQAKKLRLSPPPKLATFRMTAEDKKRKRTKILKQVFVKERIEVDRSQRNLTFPSGVVCKKGLVIQEPEAGFFYDNEKLYLDF